MTVLRDRTMMLVMAENGFTPAMQDAVFDINNDCVEVIRDRLADMAPHDRAVMARAICMMLARSLRLIHGGA